MAALEHIKAEAARLSPWAHVATVGADGKPDVVPVHPGWEGDTLWFMAFGDSVKVAKRRLWSGVLDYDLDLFSPGGPDNSPNTVFVAVQPERAVALTAYGIGGRHTWRR